MNDGPVIVHVTHETTEKIGGIGAVLNGFFTCPAYLDFAGRSIVTGPMFERDVPVSKRMGGNGELLYSSIDGVYNTPYADALAEVEKIYNTAIVYGKKIYTDEPTNIESSAEIILADVTQMYHWPVNKLKQKMYERFGIKSDLHEYIWEYEQYIRLAAVLIPALRAVNAAGETGIIVAHEWMGMPSALAAMCDGKSDFRTAFYAHEVATIRRIVEEHPGHDVHFYNAMREAQENNQYLADVFGSQDEYFKHPLVEASEHCDVVCAVGDMAAEELRFLSEGFAKTPIDVVYNGIPAYETTLDDKLESKAKLQQYCENLLGYKPDHIFTHVTRLVTSKGLWRDLEILELMDKQFTKEEKTGVLFILSTQVCRRDSNDIMRMESSYGWPVAHRQGWPDMSDGEAEFHTLVQHFNARCRNIKAVFINQFGFEQALCGEKMPADMKFTDIRRGTDVEFGLSIYEPFGISHLEPLTYGGICVLTSVCGCAGFVKKVSAERTAKNIIITDYTAPELLLPQDDPIDSDVLRRIERDMATGLAEDILSRLPKTQPDIEELIDQGYELAHKMSWQKILEGFVLPALRKAQQKIATAAA